MAPYHHQEQYVLSFGKRYQKELRVFPTDNFQLRLIEDHSNYGVEVLEALKALIDSDPEGFDYFKNFPLEKSTALFITSHALKPYKPK